MTNDPRFLTEIDLTPIIYRVDSLEKIVNSQAAQYTEIRMEIVRLEGELKGVRAQAVAHNEAHTKAMVSLEGLITRTSKELQAAVDKIVTTLGIDEDSHAASGLRDNLKFLHNLKLSREETITWTRKGIVTLILTGLGSLMVAGAYEIIRRGP